MAGQHIVHDHPFAALVAELAGPPGYAVLQQHCGVCDYVLESPLVPGPDNSDEILSK